MHASAYRLDGKPWAMAAELAGYPNTQACVMAVRRLFRPPGGHPCLPEWWPR